MMECYDIRECKEHGLKNGEAIYELHFWCKCERCNWRFEYTKGTRNEITVTTKHKNNIDNIIKEYESTSCNSLEQLKIQYVNIA